ncbi:hypothetical protein EGN69_10515 [Pseudomonas monteilii]|nr:hypothetical protein EGN69_10515 [Pseudomonas monteilii]
MITLDNILQDLSVEFSGRKLCFDLKDIPQDVVLPASWEGFGLGLDLAPVYPEGWDSFLNEFPTTLALFKDCLLGTVLLIDAEIEMVYVFHDGTSFYYYVGGGLWKGLRLRNSSTFPVGFKIFIVKCMMGTLSFQRAQWAAMP